MRNVAIVVFVAIGAAAAQTLRWPVNASASSCLRLSNNPDVAGFQTDIIEPAGADRLRARFLASNRCSVAVRVMGGLHPDGSEIQQRGPIDVLAAAIEEEGVADFTGDPFAFGMVVGRASMPSFVVPANGRTEVSALIILDGVVTPSDVVVVYVPSGFESSTHDFPYIRGGSVRMPVPTPGDVTQSCVHYEDRRCGEY